ncbi:hypothetical protein ABH944_002990 [Caballeronia udeis]|uniref:Uncharacterized protein n=1 Tax=Caballeronia udeis TaxID=1232866 RepID=A0ABW8MGR2_9BURK
MSLIGGLQPEKLRPARMKVRPSTGDQAQWKRLTQRDYLLYLVGAIQRMSRGHVWNDDVRRVLQKLDGLGGQW